MINIIFEYYFYTTIIIFINILDKLSFLCSIFSHVGFISVLVFFVLQLKLASFQLAEGTTLRLLYFSSNTVFIFYYITAVFDDPK